LFKWVETEAVGDAMWALFRVIERGGGVTVSAATQLHRIGMHYDYTPLMANALTLAVRCRTLDGCLGALLATPHLRAAWSVRNQRGLVPLHEFLLWKFYDRVIDLSREDETVALQMLQQTSIKSLTRETTEPPMSALESAYRDNVGCLELAYRLGCVDLVTELMRRGVAGIDTYLTYAAARGPKDAPGAWMAIHTANRSYFQGIVPALLASLQHIVPAPGAVPKPLLELIAQFVRGPFEL
jgi:hypothetical protein